MISYWEQSLANAFDTIILGGGLVGLQIAIHHQTNFPSDHILVLEGMPWKRGASTRNAGFACFGSPGEVLDDIERTNIDEALALVEKRFRGLEWLKKDFGAHEMQYHQTGGREIFGLDEKAEQERVLSQLDHLNKELFAITGSQVYHHANMKSLPFQCLEEGVFNPLEGALNTAALFHTIWKKASQRGICIASGVTVKEISGKEGNFLLATSEGHFRSKKLYIATNGFSQRIDPTLEVKPARGQILVTAPIPDLEWKGIVHADKGYIYFRELDGRILIGGCRNLDFKGEETDALDLHEDIQQHLEHYVKEVVAPRKEIKIAMRWSGIMGMSENRNPIIKKREDGAVVCVRMGGMGVALSAWVSREAVKLI